MEGQETLVRASGFYELVKKNGGIRTRDQYGELRNMFYEVENAINEYSIKTDQLTELMDMHRKAGKLVTLIDTFDIQNPTGYLRYGVLNFIKILFSKNSGAEAGETFYEQLTNEIDTNELINDDFIDLGPEGHQKLRGNGFDNMAEVFERLNEMDISYREELENKGAQGRLLDENFIKDLVAQRQGPGAVAARVRQIAEEAAQKEDKVSVVSQEGWQAANVLADLGEGKQAGGSVYNSIIDPDTNTIYSIFSKKGKLLLQNYLEMYLHN